MLSSHSFLLSAFKVLLSRRIFFLEKTPPGEKTKNFSRKKSNSFKEWFVASSFHLSTWTFSNWWNANKNLGWKVMGSSTGGNVESLKKLPFLQLVLMLKNYTIGVLIDCLDLLYSCEMWHELNTRMMKNLETTTPSLSNLEPG